MLAPCQPCQDCHASDWHFAISTPNGLCIAISQPPALRRFVSTLRQMMPAGAGADGMSEEKVIGSGGYITLIDPIYKL